MFALGEIGEYTAVLFVQFCLGKERVAEYFEIEMRTETPLGLHEAHGCFVARSLDSYDFHIRRYSIASREKRKFIFASEQRVLYETFSYTMRLCMASMWRDDIPITKNPLRFFLFASKPHWKVAVLAIFMAALGDVFGASVSYVFKLIANAAAALASGGSPDRLLWACALAIIILGFAKIFWRIGGFAGARWATGASATARYALTSYVTLHSRAYFSDRFAGSIMNKIRHAASGMREIVDVFLWEFLALAVNVIVSFIIAFTVSSLVAWIFFAWVCLILGVNAYLGLKRVPLAIEAHDVETQINGATVDLLTNVSAMQEYARREYETERLRSMTERRRHAHLASWYFGEWTRVLNSVLLVIFGMAMVFTVVALARNSIVSFGDIILILTIIFRIEGLLQSLGSNFNKFAETWGEIRE